MSLRQFTLAVTGMSLRQVIPCRYRGPTAGRFGAVASAGASALRRQIDIRGTAICALMSTRANHTHLPFTDSYRAGEQDPVSDSGPIFEAQIGSQFSALGSHCRIPGVC